MTGVLAIVNVTALDVAPQGLGFTTVTEAVPAVAMREAGTVAVSCVEETNVVTSAVAFQLTSEVETKFVPLTVNVKSVPPTVAQFGFSELIVGIPLIVNVSAFDVAPQVPGFSTVIETVPGLAMFAFGTVAVNCVEFLNVVASDVPFQFTVEPETKFVPFTVNVNPLPPAMAQAGLIEVIVGVAAQIVITRVALPVPPALVALMVTLYVPVVVGVPEINPVLVFTDKPAGSPVALKLVGLFVAVI
jgi:hypothetical protein